jgi:hypothetical protein
LNTGEAAIVLLASDMGPQYQNCSKTTQQ